MLHIRSSRPLSLGDILHKNLPNSVSYDAPYTNRISEGYVLLYVDSGDLNEKDDLRADGYTWQKFGKKRSKPEIKKSKSFFFKVLEF